MPLRKRQRAQYGVTKIGGNAQVHQGDSYKTQHIVVKKAYVRYREDLNLPRLRALQQLSENQSLLQESGEAGLQATSSYDAAIPKFVLTGWAGLLHIAANTLSCRINSRKNQISWNSHGQITYQDATSNSGSEFFMVVFTLLSYVIGQNVPLEELGDLLRSCQKNQVLGLMTALLGLATYQCFTKHSIKPISSPPGLLLQDAYGHERCVSLDVCADSELFFQFLTVHYRSFNGAAAVEFVKTGQHHLTIGSRRGPYVDPSSWSVDELPVGTKLIDSVYVFRQSTSVNCLICSRPLYVDETDGWTCFVCNVYHRNRITLAQEASQREAKIEIGYNRVSVHADLNKQGTNRPMIQGVSKPQEPHARLSGLVNIDLRIVSPDTDADVVTTTETPFEATPLSDLWDRQMLWKNLVSEDDFQKIQCLSSKRLDAVNGNFAACKENHPELSDKKIARFVLGAAFLRTHGQVMSDSNRINNTSAATSEAISNVALENFRTSEYQMRLANHPHHSSRSTIIKTSR